MWAWTIYLWLILASKIRKEATHVRLGDFNYGADKETYQPLNVRIGEVILHPKYTKKSLYDNLALVQLDQSVKFGMHIRPACLPQMFDVAEQTVTMTGWPFKLYRYTVQFLNRTHYLFQKSLQANANEYFIFIYIVVYQDL